MNKNYTIEIIVTDEETDNTKKGKTNTNLLQDLSIFSINKEPKDIVWDILDTILKEFEKER